MNTVSRKSYLVLPSFQLKLGAFLILLLLIGTIIHGFFLYSITARNIAEGFLSAHNRLRSTWEILKPAVVLTNGLSFLILSLSFVMISILLTHRLIGPLFKIRGRIHDLAIGRLNQPPLQLRKGDEGQMLCDAVNEVQQALRYRFDPLVELKKQVDLGKNPSPEELKIALEKALHDIQTGE